MASAQPTQRQDSHSQTRSERRNTVRVACQECRTRKAKCDGGRPACDNCLKKQSPCHYEADPNETRVGALKRKYADLERQTADHQRFLHMLKATESEHDALELVRRVRAGQEVSAIVSTTSSDEPCPNPHSEVRSGPPERHKRSVGSEEGSADLDHPSPGAVSGQSASTNVTSGSRSPGKRRVSVHSMLSNDADSQRSAGPSALPSPTAVPGPSSSGGEGFFRAIGSTRAAAGSDNRSGYSFDTSSRRPISGWRAAFNDSCQGTAAAPSDAMPTPPLKTTKRPFQEVRAADWGVDYIRDEVFQEILESFLFWDHPTWAIFDEIAFRDGITHGGSEYCNRFLVHTIIAFAAKIYGTFYFDRVDAAEKHALEAARRLWREESGTAIPANIVGAVVMNAYSSCAGQEEIPSEYMKQAVFLAHQMGLYSANRAPEVYAPAHPTRTRGRAVLAWGLFSYQAYLTCFFNQPPLLTTFPPIPIPDVEPAEDDETWTPFPLQYPRKPCCSSTRFVARAGLWSIGNDIMPLHRRYQHKLGSSEHVMNALALYDRLRAWHDGLDVRLLRLYDAPPHLFQLHTDYYRGVIELFRPFLDVPEEKRATWPAGAYEQAIRVSVASHRQVRFLLQELDRQFRDLPLPLGTLNPLVLVADNTIAHLTTDPENGEHVYYLSLCLRMTLRMAESFTIAPTIAHGILQVARRQNVALPAEARAIVQLLKDNRFRGTPAGKVLNTFPVDLGLMRTDDERSRLRNLVGETEQMSLD